MVETLICNNPGQFRAQEDHFATEVTENTETQQFLCDYLPCMILCKSVFAILNRLSDLCVLCGKKTLGERN